MVMQSLLLLAGDLDSVQQAQKVGGRNNGAAERVSASLPRLAILYRREATAGCALDGAFCARRVQHAKCPSPPPPTQPNITDYTLLNHRWAANLPTRAILTLQPEDLVHGVFRWLETSVSAVHDGLSDDMHKSRHASRPCRSRDDRARPKALSLTNKANM